MRPVAAAVLALAFHTGLWAAPAPARGFAATVTRVSDGDTLWVRPERGGPPRKLRLHGIDAPEICQPGGVAARDALQALALHRPVQVSVLRRDDYQRLLARVTHQGDDLARAMVRQGHAWSYRYRRDPGPYGAEEQEARRLRRGLFAVQPGPQAPESPRAFRRRHGPCP